MTEEQKKIAGLHKLRSRLAATTLRHSIDNPQDTNILFTKAEWLSLYKFVNLVRIHLHESRNDYETPTRRKLSKALKEVNNI